MAAIEERIVDRQILKVLRTMLRVGEMQDRAIARRSGPPPGGVISPVLANVYLHRLDRCWQQRGPGVIARYAGRSVADVPHAGPRPKRRSSRFGRS